MPYLPDLNVFLHQSSLLIQAYPTTTRITTKYSQPRNRKTLKSKKAKYPTSAPAQTEPNTNAQSVSHRELRETAATLTLKTFEAGSGICLKYETDKAAEVGRLMTGLGRLASGELVEMPTVVPPHTQGEDKAEVSDHAPAFPQKMKGSGEKAVKAEAQAQSSGSGGKKKKHGGKK